MAAIEIFDCRGRPTLAASVTLADKGDKCCAGTSALRVAAVDEYRQARSALADRNLSTNTGGLARGWFRRSVCSVSPDCTGAFGRHGRRAESPVRMDRAVAKCRKCRKCQVNWIGWR